MQLRHNDSLQLQASETPLTSGPQMLGATSLLPPIGSRAQRSRLGGDDEVVRIWMKRLRDELFAHLGSVGVRRVDQCDAELHGPTHDGDRLVVIARLSPNPLARDPHGAEAEAVDRQVAADGERAAPRSGAKVVLRGRGIGIAHGDLSTFTRTTSASKVNRGR